MKASNFVNEFVAAEYLAVSVHTMRKWRLFRKGPAFVKVGAKAVRYRVSDLEAFIGQTAPNGKGA